MWLIMRFNNKSFLSQNIVIVLILLLLLVAYKTFQYLLHRLQNFRRDILMKYFKS